MIKVHGPEKVKERPILSGAMIAVIAFLALSHLCAAQVSEKELQGQEEQEFGIDTGVQAKPDSGAPKTQAPLEDHQPESEQEKIKPIEAEEFKATLAKKSHSGRVLLFQDPSENRPRPGKILLLKEGETDLVAIRVLKNYKGKFAGKIVLPFKEIKVGGEYRVLKKLGDKIIAMIQEREKRGKDLDALKSDEDLAKEVSPDDNELDRGIPTATAAAKGAKNKPKAEPKPEVEPLFTKNGDELSEGIEVQDEDEPLSDLSVQEELPLEPNRHAVSLEYGSIRSVNLGGGTAMRDSLGLRYAYTFWRMPFLHRKSFQDSFAAELGLFYYTVTNFLGPSDTSTITVFPLLADLRYNLLIGEYFTIFGYLGLIKNNVSADPQTLSAGASVIATTQFAFGVGGMLKIGPSWAVRLEYGTDLFGVGAVLRF